MKFAEAPTAPISAHEITRLIARIKGAANIGAASKTDAATMLYNTMIEKEIKPKAAEKLTRKVLNLASDFNSAFLIVKEALGLIDHRPTALQGIAPAAVVAVRIKEPTRKSKPVAKKKTTAKRKAPVKAPAKKTTKKKKPVKPMARRVAAKKKAPAKRRA